MPCILSLRKATAPRSLITTGVAQVDVCTYDEQSRILQTLEDRWKAMKDGKASFDVPCKLEVPSKKGRSRAVGLRSVLLLVSACNS